MLLNRVFILLIILKSIIFASQNDSVKFEEVYEREDFSTRNQNKVNWRPADDKEMFPHYITFSVGVLLYVITMMNVSGAINAD